MNDLRKEQLALLRFEKQIAGLAVTLAAGAAVAKGVDGKLHAASGSEAYAQIQDALVNLAQATSQAHDALNVKALEIGANLFEAAGGGLPKPNPETAVRSILGLG
ncbi:hypothetical protein PUV54_08780 [Hyphococcus flavus]|uniref:Uncharacterized protein n=1 Tax=Hyphococcus flavus TaxID=1866326 RepID=A0AAE9ZC15_9PROT|nr:hypothetical protein [Hyphococcus flavus]WDI30052.1 hypothetical protein PUV54_08780 [Hyphococcus flavus]